MIFAAISWLCLVAIIIGVIMRFGLAKYVDKERMKSVENPSQAFSILGPSYEVLTDKGKALLATSYVLFGGGFLVTFLIGIFRRFLR
jgi:hypothetical protein